MQTIRKLATALAVAAVAGTGFGATAALANHQFSDVPTGNAFHGDVEWLADHGIAAGFPDGTFDPTAPIKRQQASRWFRNYNASLQRVTNQVDPPAGSSVEVTVDCPDGWRVLVGSGAVEAGYDLTIADSYANETYQWLVRFDAPGNGSVDPASAEATALCAPDL